MSLFVVVLATFLRGFFVFELEADGLVLSFNMLLALVDRH